MTCTTCHHACDCREAAFADWARDAMMVISEMNALMDSPFALTYAKWQHHLQDRKNDLFGDTCIAQQSPVTRPKQGQFIGILETDDAKYAAGVDVERIEYHQNICDDRDRSCFWIFSGDRVLEKVPFSAVTHWEKIKEEINNSITGG